MTQVASPRGAELEAALARLMAASRVSTRAPDRTAYARDMWARGLMAARAGEIGPQPDAVVWPESTAEVQAIVRLCGERGVPVVPFGAGSGVCGASVPVRRGVVLEIGRAHV